jgi:hypothetical protein
VFGLPPGEYLVQAQPSGLITGALAGASDAPQTTAAEVSWAQAVGRGRADGAPAPMPLREPDYGRRMNYATVYFPGTANPALATGVRVGPGEERTSVDFALMLVPTAKVSGLVLDASGAPMAKASVALEPQEQTMNVMSLVTARPLVRSGADGSFSIPAVAPGTYQLVARVGPGATAGLWARQTVVVSGQDVSGVVLDLQPGLTVSGRLAFVTTSLPAPGADDLVKARVTLTPVSEDGGAAEAVFSGPSSTASSLAADGTFAVTGLMPNRYRVSIAMPGVRTNPAAPSGGWSLASIRHGSIDVTDGALEIRAAEDGKELIATFSDRPSELTGTLSDQTGQPAPGYPIVVFSTRRSDWTRGSRRIAVARPSTDGSFRLIGLPPGTYYLCAVASLDPSDLEDPMFLDALVPASITIALEEGVRTDRPLQLGR